MKTFKRILSIVLVLVMTATAVPAFIGFSPKAEARTTVRGTIYITKEDLESGYINLGSYPQSQVTDSSLLSTLGTKMPGLNTSAWISYGYYSGDGDYGSMKQDVAMQYTDVEYNSAKYRCVIFSYYRPRYTINEANKDNSYQDNNNYTLGVYWFKFEPLKWRVLDKDTGLIMCENIIDSQAYCNTVYVTVEQFAGTYGTENKHSYYSDAAHNYKQNEYAKSSIRAWLNNDFYNTAFSAADKTAIATSKIADFGYECNTSLYEEGKYLSDKIFLLGQTEAFTSSYGFKNTSTGPDEANHDSAKAAKSTDYAKCQGIEVNDNDCSSYYGNSAWLLRTASPDSKNYYGSSTYIINSSGGMTTPGLLYSTSWGIRPCLKINLHTHAYTAIEDIILEATHLSEGYKCCYCICGAGKVQKIDKTSEHTYIPSTKEATCTEDGLITYTCACGDKYTVTISAGHKFEGNNADCENCDYVCSCNCHKTGISKFFFSIALFFQKLFGNNKVCTCGRNHY